MSDGPTLAERLAAMETQLDGMEAASDRTRLIQARAEVAELEERLGVEPTGSGGGPETKTVASVFDDLDGVVSGAVKLAATPEERAAAKANRPTVASVFDDLDGIADGSVTLAAAK